ncbi:TcmI family type II polyketide cyclase [Streptomyces griseorubiginosus]|uniref:TcmI family type II polyketide cyclase n=1 Tax=Streptomyces griseorubiginosus TaxID=67304 RepID=UPI00367D4CCC
MFTVVSVGRLNGEYGKEISEIFAEFDAATAPGIPGLKRRQLYSYYDVFVHIQDFTGENADEKAEAAAKDSRVAELSERLAPLITAYDPTLADDRAAPFYHWEGDPPVDKETGLHSTVIVNRVADEVVPEVARLFGELDATDFPYRMGTRRRQLFSYHGVYFHIQDFPSENGTAVIDQAWKQADPRFVKICADLDPLVKKYAPERWRSTADQIAHRFYLWEASA